MPWLHSFHNFFSFFTDIKNRYYFKVYYMLDWLAGMLSWGLMITSLFKFQKYFLRFLQNTRLHISADQQCESPQIYQSLVSSLDVVLSAPVTTGIISTISSTPWLVVWYFSITLVFTLLVYDIAKSMVFYYFLLFFWPPKIISSLLSSMVWLFLIDFNYHLLSQPLACAYHLSR